jgi:hypothetical protein
MIRFAAKLILGSVILAGLASVADAKQVKRYHAHYAAAPVVYARPPLTVNKRSFLDPGPVVPVGSESAYMVQNTYFAQTPDQNNQRSKFGNEALPRPLEVPGRPAPIYEFETPGYPY